MSAYERMRADQGNFVLAYMHDIVSKGYNNVYFAVFHCNTRCIIVCLRSSAKSFLPANIPSREPTCALPSDSTL